MSNIFFQGGRKKFRGSSPPCAHLVTGTNVRMVCHHPVLPTEGRHTNLDYIKT